MANYGDLWAEIAAVVLPAMRGYRASVTSMPVSRKPNGTLVSEADVAIQDLIVGILSRYYPRAGMVAETCCASSSVAAGK